MQKSKTRSASNLSFQVTELDESLIKKNKILIWTVNGILFVISLILFIVGIVYLSGAYYAYSFTSYSTTLLAGLFIAFGAVCMALAAINVVFAQTHRNLNVLMGVTIISVFYLVLLAISIWGLSVTADRDKLKETLKINILTNLRGYEGNTLNKEETMKIDWLQSKFNCCGLNSYFDWQMYYQTSGASGTIVGGLPPTNWNIMNNQAGVINNNNNNNNPQSQPNVPDSCCVKSYPNCGKNYYKANNNVVPNNNNNNNNNFNNNNSNYFQTVQGNNNNVNNWEYYGQNLFNRYLLINLNGCLEVYLTRFYSDILFLTLLCFFSSLLALFLYIVLISGSYRLNKGF